MTEHTHQYFPQPDPEPEPKAPRAPWKVAALAVAATLAIGGMVGAAYINMSSGSASASGTSCNDDLGPLSKELSAISAELEVGIIEADYSKRMREISVVEGEIDVDELSTKCANLYAPVADLIIDYNTIAMEWNDCIIDSYCDTDTDLDTSAWDNEVIQEFEDALAGKTDGKDA